MLQLFLVLLSIMLALSDGRRIGENNDKNSGRRQLCAKQFNDFDLQTVSKFGRNVTINNSTINSAIPFCDWGKGTVLLVSTPGCNYLQCDVYSNTSQTFQLYFRANQNSATIRGRNTGFLQNGVYTAFPNDNTDLCPLLTTSCPLVNGFVYQISLTFPIQFPLGDMVLISSIVGDTNIPLAYGAVKLTVQP